MQGTLAGPVRKYWFVTSLMVVCLGTVLDPTGTLALAGRWLKARQGPDVVLVLVFFFSGILLKTEMLKSGLRDLQGTLTALTLTFVAAPVIAFLLGILPMAEGIKVGLFLVAVMPTTLSSGVVMTQAAGGNMAHSLFITLVAHAMAVFTIPFTLSLMPGPAGTGTGISLDQQAIMLKIGLLVLLPLGAGWGARAIFRAVLRRFEPILGHVNQGLIVLMVWMGISGARTALLGSAGSLAVVVGLAVLFHIFLLCCAFAAVVFLKRNRTGQRESIIFMGGQKTLVLAVILQITLFPQYGLALVFLVVHHVAHLTMDGYLVHRLNP